MEKITQPVIFVNTDGFLNKDNQKKWTFLQPKVKEFVNMEPSMQILQELEEEYWSKFWNIRKYVSKSLYFGKYDFKY